jgi:hypothetical protein
MIYLSNLTKKLRLNLLSGLEKLHKDTFNGIIEDIDNKCVGIAHLQENSHWKLWEKFKDYTKGDVVRTSTCKSNQYFQCIVSGKSAEFEPKNLGTGAQITDNTTTWIINEIGSSDSSNGGAVIFIGEKYYTKGQLAVFNGVLYRSIKDHIAKTTFQEDFENWQKLYSNIRQWSASTFYFNGEIVINDNKLYKCNKDHTSGETFISDISNWDLLSYSGIESFEPSKYYEQNSVVVDDNRLYRCTLAHTSKTDFISDIENWKLLSNIQDWEKSKNYIQGNIVLYDHTPYKVIKNHVSNDFSLDKDNFEITYSNIRDFNPTMFYKKGSYVLYNNNIYKALKDTTGDIGHKLQLQTNNPDWQKITNTQKPSIETWRTGTDYKKNEIVVYNEKIYKCATDHTSGSDFSVDKPKYWESLSDNPIINDWISENNYEVGTCVIKSNQNGIVDWTASKQYNVNDEVVYNGYIYTCKTQNTDAEFTEANWKVKEPVYNRIYRCIKNTNSKDFNESEWQLINGDSKATVDEVDELLA